MALEQAFHHPSDENQHDASRRQYETSVWRYLLPPHLSRTWSTFLSSTRYQSLQDGTIRLVQDAELDTIWIALQVGF